MNEHEQVDETPLPPTLALQVDAVCLRFEQAWQQVPPRPRIEDYLNGIVEAARAELLAELLALDLEYRRRLGETPQPEEYCQRFPDDPAIIHARFHATALSERALARGSRQTLPDALVEGGPAELRERLPKVPGYEVLELVAE